jgi:superfamily II DNA or RNA helicase
MQATIPNEKKLYAYQEQAIDKLFKELYRYDDKVNLLFQLPTGGGKTYIFSHIARKFIRDKGQKVLILTHRIELCRQTSLVLHEVGVNNKVISADVKKVPDQENYQCFTAMVETLNNRLRDDREFLHNVGLVIVDEAHYNSFRKIFKYFRNVNILGVTATPLSSNRNLPLNENYRHLVIGESIRSLIENEYLSKATTYTYDVNLNGLKVGVHGDYTISSIERVYSQAMMQTKLLDAYQEVAEGKKTLIFNAGIVTSRAVERLFERANYPIRHLDSTFPKEERKEALRWFRDTPGAILTSVGILTTGFDEPSVECIILNRATRSLTLYHQMIGRGSRIWKNKRNFSIIDLGNNAMRLGLWDDPIDWYEVFLYPDRYLDRQLEIERRLEERDYDYEMPAELRKRFRVMPDTFDLRERYRRYAELGQKPKRVLDDCIEHHVQMIQSNTSDLDEGLELVKLLEDEIEHRIQQYRKCVNGTESYASWLKENYQRDLYRKVYQLLA